MRPICVKCSREMLPKKNEVLVKDKATDKFPSTYHYGDLYECPGCGAQIVAGFGTAVPSDCLSSFETDTALEFSRE